MVVEAAEITDIFAGALDAMYQVMGCDISSTQPKEQWVINAEAESLDVLLVDFLNEALFLFGTKGMLAHTLMHIQLRHTESGYSLIATIFGETYCVHHHGALKEIKAVTFHQAEVIEHESGVRAQVIFDL